MAENPAEGSKDKPKKGKKFLIIILVALIVLIAVLAGAGYFLYMSNQGDRGGAEATEHEVKPVAKPIPAPVYHPMDTLVVNVQGEDGAGILQMGFDLQIRDAAFSPTIDAYRPRIVNSLILLISSKSINELRTADGKAKLQAQIRQVVNEALLEAGLDAPVINVAYTSFIIQE